MITSLKRWGNSQGLRFSKEMLEAIGISIYDKVNVEVKDRKIIISKVQDEKINLKELFADYQSDYKTEEFNWGKPKGEEVW
jgi:antitoxin MazE